MYSLQRKLAGSDCGENRKIKISAVAGLMADCEQFQVDSEEYIASYFKKTNMGIYVCARQIDFLKMPSYTDVVTATTSIYSLTPLFGFRNTYIIDTSSGETLIKSYAQGAFVDLETQKIAKISKEYIDGYTLDKQMDIEMTPRRIELPLSEPESSYPARVLKDYIDHYGHMNNAHYITLAAEFLPRGFNVKRLRCEYKAAAKGGDEMQTKIYRSGNIMTVVFKGPEDIVYFICEFTRADE